MKPTKILLMSVFLTAVILAVVSGAASTALARRAAEAAPSQDLAIYQEREAAYQQTIEQANAQLTALQERVMQLESQPAAAESGASAPAAALSPEQAQAAALAAAGPGQFASKAPELVSFEGKTAYEVAFNAGSIFIDAQTAQVLFNGVVPQEITAEQAAQIASEYLGISDIYLVDQIQFRGSPLWRVIFKNSTIAYLDLTGQITYVLRDSNKAVTVQASDNGGGGREPRDGGGGDDGEHEDD